MPKKTVPVIFMIAGAAMLLGIGLFALDRATSPEPTGLGTGIATVLGLLFGAAAGIKGWLDFNKKEAPPQTTKIDVAAQGSSVGVGSLDVGGNIGGSILIGNTINLPAGEAVFRSLHQLPSRPPTSPGGRNWSPSS
jgi:hypothetical protein